MTKKKHLTERQHQRIAANQKKRFVRAEKPEAAEQDLDLFAESEPGLVISRFGQHADIEATDGSVHRCSLRRVINSLVTGDKVIWRRAKAANSTPAGVVEAAADRESVLVRPDFYDGLKPVAANIDLMIIVSAVLPVFSSNIVDRYLIAAEAMHIKPLLLLNKVDLLSDEERAVLEQQLQMYTSLGYDFLLLSAKTGEGTAQMNNYLQQGCSIFVGQSGVGKSSLLNAVLPGIDAITKEVSEVSGLGQHTTTTARLYHLPQGGDLIDSPGIREFALWHLEPEQVAAAYPEFQPWLGRCKFRDCKHQNDPGCALQHAVSQGDIHPERFHNYHKILLSMQQDKPNYFSN